MVLLRKGTSHGDDDVQQLPGTAARTSPWWCRCRWCCTRRTSRRCRADVFDHIDALSAPRLVEYWEQDPCRPRRSPTDERRGGVGSGTAVGPRAGAQRRRPRRQGRGAVRRRRVRDRDPLGAGLGRPRDLAAPEQVHDPRRRRGGAGALRARADEVLRRQGEHSKGEATTTTALVVLSPLRFDFDSDELRLPVRLGLLNADGKQDLIVYVLHPEKRFEVANYPNVFVPTNLEVADEVRKNFAGVLRGAVRRDAGARQRQGGGHRVRVADHVVRSRARRRRCSRAIWPPSAPIMRRSQRPADAAAVVRAAATTATSPSWVLTRLHTRYDKATLSEDLIFREAKPVMGGRANWDGTSADAGRAGVEREQLPGPLHHPSLLDRAGEVQAARATTSGADRRRRRATRARRRRKRPGAGAARQGRAQEGRALAGADAGAAGQPPPHRPRGACRWRVQRSRCSPSLLPWARARRRRWRRSTEAGPDPAALLLGPVTPSAATSRGGARAGLLRRRRLSPRRRGLRQLSPRRGGAVARSAHRFASFNNPYYAASVEAFRKERPAGARSAPAATIRRWWSTGAIDAAGSIASAPEAQAGIVCLVCHSIDHVDLRGNGTTTRARAVRTRRRRRTIARLRPAMLDEAKLCAGCHKVGLTPEVTARPLAARAERLRCLAGERRVGPRRGVGVPAGGRRASAARTATCRYEPALLGDAGAKPEPDGLLRVRSHRFLGANTALPPCAAMRSRTSAVRKFLAGAASLDLVWVGRARWTW